MQNDRAEVPIAVSHLKKAFGNQTVLNGVSFRVGQGETVGVLGRSGTGKSVLLKLIIRLLDPDSGSVLVTGSEIGTLAERDLSAVRKKIGFLFQQAALYDSLTVQENVAFPLQRHTRNSDAHIAQRAHELLGAVGMDGHFDKLPSQISGGMQKRVAMARALALDPEILLLDEPTAGLDPITAGEISHLISSLNRSRKLTAVVVTHDVESVKVFADRLLLLRDGDIVADGTFADLQAKPDRFVQQFLGPALSR